MNLLSIPDIAGNFYGGSPYSVNLDIGFVNSPSTLTVQCVSQDGTYLKPNLSNSLNNKLTIKVGDFNFQGFLVSYKKNLSVSQKTLELRYIDTSILLDKTWIGLHKRHGINVNASRNYNSILDIAYAKFDNAPSSNIIIMGREMHPCDINGDGNINGFDTETIDACDPCPSCPTEKYKYRCGAENDLKIFEVKYTFAELLSSLGVAVPTSVSNQSTYYREYQGKLREVLKNWCNDFGLTFYWEPSASTLGDGIRLVDRTVPISINFRPDECDITELYEGESVENCFLQGTISYYAREGQSKNYNCSNTSYYNLSSLKLRDLFNEDNYENFDVNIRWRELAVGLSYYSSSLRDCMFWFQYYSLTNATRAKAKIFNILGYTNNSILNKDQSKILKELGNMKILQVIDKADKNFQDCVDLMGDSLEDYNKRSNNDLKREDGNPSYYFFVADYDETLASSQLGSDTNWAENYLGKFWVTTANPASCGGINGNSRYPSVSVKGYGQENGNWIPQGVESSNLQFNNFGHQAGSNIDSFGIDSSDTPEASDTETSKSVILLQRDGKWYPNKANISDYQATINYYDSLVFKKVDTSSGGKPNLLGELNAKYPKMKNVSLFIVQEVDENLTLSISEVDNFLEPNQLEKIYASNDDSGPCVTNTKANNNGKVLIGTVGLKNSKCAWVDFDGFSFMMPAQSTELAGSDITNPFSDNPNLAGYKTKVDISFDIPVCIPKIQTMLSSIPNETNFASLDINAIDITDYDMKVLGVNSCIPNAETLAAVHKTKGIQTSISNTSPEKLLQYKKIGLPKDIPSISEGLDNISVEVNDAGVFTTYSLSDKLREKLSIELINNNLINKSYGAITPYVTMNTKNIPKGL